MGSTKSGKRKLPPAAPKQLPAEGAANKRTPQSTFDAAAGKDTYEPERVVAERLAKGVTQYQVKWAGFDPINSPINGPGDSSNTNDPLVNILVIVITDSHSLMVVSSLVWDLVADA